MNFFSRTFTILLFTSLLLIQACTGLVRFSSSGSGINTSVSSQEKPVPEYEPRKPQSTPSDSQPKITKELQEKPLQNIDEKKTAFDGRLYSSGEASFYGGKFHGRKTANGEIFDSLAYTAAHKSLPFNTKVRVENIKNGKSVVVRINDRGPFTKSRIIDLSVAAARDIDMIISGKADVDVYILE
jgi:rare lipoprotein A